MSERIDSDQRRIGELRDEIDAISKKPVELWHVDVTHIDDARQFERHSKLEFKFRTPSGKTWLLPVVLEGGLSISLLTRKLRWVADRIDEEVAKLG